MCPRSTSSDGRASRMKGVVDPVRKPEQRQLAQGRQVPNPEVVGQRRVDLRRRVDIAVGEPPAQRLGGHVDKLDLVGAPHDLVRHGLPLFDAGDRLDHVVERFEMLDVHRRDDVDADCE